MTYVERRLLLRNGPPWGFRLYEDFMEGLIVSKIRKRSPAEVAGMLEGDHLLALNGLDALDMSHSRAVQIIDSSSYTLEVIVGRYERLHRMETIYLDNQALRQKRLPPQEITTTELQLFWEKEMPLRPARTVLPAPKPTVILPTPAPVVRRVSPPPKPVTIQIPPPPPPPPPPPAPAPRSEDLDWDRKIVPIDPDVSSISVKQLMKEFDVPPIAPELKKKHYGDSTFYSDPTRYYPTIEEQIEMARKVANSLQAPENTHSRGVNMFEKQKQRAEKYVREGPDPEPDPIEMASPEELENMTPPSPPPPPPPPPPSFPGLQPVDKTYSIPPPPTLPPGQPKTVQEFLEKIKVFPASKHSDIDPQKCFDIATALYTSDSRGAKMFARRHARAKKWDNEAEETAGRNVAMAQQSATPEQIKAKLISKLGQTDGAPQFVLPALPRPSGKPEPVRPTRTSLVSETLSSQTSQDLSSFDEGTPKPFALDSPFSVSGPPPFGDQSDLASTTAGSTVDGEGSKTGWRPVKFKMAQAAN